jgi:ComF family protein
MVNDKGGDAIFTGILSNRLPPSDAWTGFMRYAGKVLSEAIFPRKCRACGAHWTLNTEEMSARCEDLPASDLSAVFQILSEPYLCPACMRSFEPLASPLCTRCGVMFDSCAGEDHLCGACIRRPPTYRQARAVGIYSGGLMALIQHLKYRACLALKHPLARLLQAAFDQHWPGEEVDMVLPIPLHSRRWRERGFNQAQMLVEAWAKLGRAEDSSAPQFPRACRIFVRSKPTSPQTGLGKRARRQNIRGAFSVIDPNPVKDAHILLVDDVYTTGATADEAARALKRNGAACVDILTVARTMPRSRSQGPQ